MKQKVIWAIATILVYLSFVTALWTLGGGSGQYDEDGNFIPKQKQEVIISDEANSILKAAMSVFKFLNNIIPVCNSTLWYFVMALPVFLFSPAFYLILRQMRRNYYENAYCKEKMRML